MQQIMIEELQAAASKKQELQAQLHKVEGYEEMLRHLLKRQTQLMIEEQRQRLKEQAQQNGQVEQEKTQDEQA